MRCYGGARTLVAALAVSMAAVACRAGVMRSLGYDYYIRQAARGDTAVGQFTADHQSLFTGTLIRSNWVLTAASALDTAGSLSFRADGHSYTADRWYTPDSWLRQPFAGNDIALVHLDRAVTGVGTVGLYQGDPIGNDADVVGYGAVGTGITGPVAYDGVRRAGRNRIDKYLFSNVNLLSMDLDVAPDNPNYAGPWPPITDPAADYPLPLEYIPAQGDAGGPDLIDGKIAGINSAAIGLFDGVTDLSFTDTAVATNVSSWRSWIQQVIDAIAADQTPQHVRTGVPGVAIFAADQATNLTLAGVTASASLTGGIPPFPGNTGYFLGSLNPTAFPSTPEPGALATLLVGLAVLGLRRQRVSLSR